MGRRLGRAHPPAFDPHPGAVAGLTGGHQLHPGDRGDGRERLAAKAEAGHPLQVLELGDLAGGVPVEGQQRVVPAHAAAVIDHPDPTLAAALELDPHLAGAGVDGVLEELLDQVGRSLDHLAGCNLVDQRVIEQLYRRTHGVRLSKLVSIGNGAFDSGAIVDPPTIAMLP